MRIGKLPESALMRSVLGQLYAELPERLEQYGADCAAFGCAVSSKKDGMDDRQTLAGLTIQRPEYVVPVYTAVGPIPGFGNQPGVSVVAAANNLAAGGAVPQAITVHAVLPPSFEEHELKKAMKELVKAAEVCGMQVICGHTEVSDAVDRPLYQMTGIGQVCIEDANQRPMLGFSGNVGWQQNKGQAGAGWTQKKLCPGQALVVTKWIALAGTVALAEAHEEELHARFPLFLTDQAKAWKPQLSVVRDAQIASRIDGCAMHDLSQGGIFGALWEMAQRAGVGLEVDLKRIPIRQETVEICEYFDINPYGLYSAGALLVGTSQPEALVQALIGHGIPAAVIGRVTDGNDRIIRNGEEVRFLDRPQQDEWYRRFGGKE